MADSAQNVAATRTGPDAPVALTTHELTTTEARARWSTLTGSMFCEMDLELQQPRRRFDCELLGQKVGDLYVSRMRADPHTVLRTPAMIDSDPGGDYLLCFVTRGHAELRQGGRDTQLEHGSFAVLDAARPFRFHSPGVFEQIVVRAPREALVLRLPFSAVDTVTACAVSGLSGAGGVVSTLVQRIATLSSDLIPGVADALSAAALDMLGAVFAHTNPSASATEQAHIRDLHRAQQALQKHLHDPTCSIADIAAELGMSVRYLQKLFCTIGTTPTAWVSWTRLNRARSMLLTTDITVSDLSQRVGFQDVSHFIRAFRRQFGTSPGRYRRERAS